MSYIYKDGTWLATCLHCRKPIAQYLGGMYWYHVDTRNRTCAGFTGLAEPTSRTTTHESAALTMVYMAWLKDSLDDSLGDTYREGRN